MFNNSFTFNITPLSVFLVCFFLDCLFINKTIKCGAKMALAMHSLFFFCLLPVLYQAVKGDSKPRIFPHLVYVPSGLHSVSGQGPQHIHSLFADAILSRLLQRLFYVLD